MQTSIKKWGNSAGAIIPAAVLKKAGFGMGDPVEIEVVKGRIVMSSAAPTFSLDELLSVSPKGAFELDSEDAQWLSSHVGREEIL
ncbi:TPA: AbrB/MazE/SpoVT family DNA-binding domain-containing protein [Shewanella algae]|uniref:AbrB/MazE/SpoVT family DNA-binding domain-containing protein n=1 Tax=Shewanella TaxID=22 RepID=UPI001431A07C|nr:MULTISPECIES: AbrB/MazE/SpoVT family DNA-binding domain-containing protein [Shewanella]NJI86991.1 AbrB/MazE/SpoVT family DNA-binding domain-containing protein [Shewanella sp. Iso12]HDS1208405.1 AbrB/MazE/SpoVT family DNA-binding domain-containing protein [Shewanella algae]